MMRLDKGRFFLLQVVVVATLWHVRAFVPSILQPLQKHHKSFSTTCFLAKNWNDWDGEEEEDQGPPVKPDMKYVPRNLQRQLDNFEALKAVGGKEVVRDVYARDPLKDVWFFVGKVATISDVTPEQAVARQRNIIELHASNLRPRDLFPAKNSMELWIAPGDSELEVAYNRPDVIMHKVERQIEGAESIKNNLIGFTGEVYEPGEEGFRTWRLEDGRPARPEVSGPSPSIQDAVVEDLVDDNDDEAVTRTPTDEEMAEIQERLKGQDLNKLYEEQQRRAGKPLD